MSALSNKSCSTKRSTKWSKSWKTRAPCRPVVDQEIYNKMAIMEECNNGDACSIINLYKLHCESQGAFIQAKC